MTDADSSAIDWDRALYDTVAAGKRIANFADESMFVAEPATDRLPKVTLIHANNDPLGQLAQLAMMYQGKSPRNLEDISDDDRAYYINDMEKNILGMPSESIMFHFLIENVTRSYTHQLVRTRHASYAQESLRFAVKEDFPVGLPPYLQGTNPTAYLDNLEEGMKLYGAHDSFAPDYTERVERAEEWAQKNTRTEDIIRMEWDQTCDHIHEKYLSWIERGMPAEDARGITPHNILTKVNMVISLRSLMAMAGQRLCTQAQFEHRMVWNELIKSIRSFGYETTYRTTDANIHAGAVFEETGDSQGGLAYEVSSQWQFELLAARFQPICYQTGSCQFQSDFDRYCNIRDRVQANAKIGRKSSEWHKPHTKSLLESVTSLGMPSIGAIGPYEWLDPKAAIRKDSTWRSEQAQKNIRDRRL